MFRSICVPLDGSPFSERALPIARAIARKTGASIDLALVHVPYIVSYVNGVPITNDELDAERRAVDQTYLDRTRQQLAGEGLTVVATLLEGAVAPALADHIAARGHDLVVMTTHGRGGFARFWLGSTADALIRHITTPVLLLRPGDQPAERASEPAFTHILIPLDGSQLAEQIIPPATALGQLSDAAYTLLQVVEPSELMRHGADADVRDVEQTVTQRRLDAAREYLDARAAQLRARGLRVQTAIVGVNPPAAAILGHARQHGADLIAMATHGRGGLARVLLGSTADKVVRGAEMPVLLLRPREDDA